MTDYLLGSICGLLIAGLFIFILYLLLDFNKLRLIKFKVDGNDYWEITFDEKELRRRMNGRMGEVIMPERPVIVRILRYFFPLHHENAEVERETVI